MSTQIQRRRGTTAEHSTFTGAAGEITIDSTKNTVVVHDGTTAGGYPLIKEADALSSSDIGVTVQGYDANLPTWPSAVDATEVGYLDGVTSAIQTQLDTKVETLSDLSITATDAELNLLDGATVTTAEINYNDISTLGTSEASKVVTADANGNVKLSEEVQATCYIETSVTVPSTTIDCDEGNLFYKTISANTTFSFSYSGVNLTSNDAYAFTLILTVSGTRTVSWPASVDWAGGSAPDAPASGETDVFVFVTRNGGSTWYGFQAGDALA